MIDFFKYIGMIGIDNQQQVIIALVRLVLATILGAVIGIERGRKHRPAGLRTHTLVCVASALVMLTNEQLIHTYGLGDPTRMGAQVISGIGFLGAGTILTDRQNRVRGLTTAAGLWASACVGLAIGSGYYLGGIFTCLLMLLIFTKFIDVESRFVKKSRIMDLVVSFDGPKNLNHFLSEITSRDCSVISFEYIDLHDDQHWSSKWEKEVENPKKIVSANLHILLPISNYNSEVMNLLEKSKGMIMMEEM